MIAYQTALARAVAGGGGAVPGVSDAQVKTFTEIALRKRLAALRALLPRTLASLGRARFESHFRAFAANRASCGPERYRDEAVAFARSLGEPIARREARIVAAFGPARSFAVVRERHRMTVLFRLRHGGRLHAVQLFR